MSTPRRMKAGAADEGTRVKGAAVQHSGWLEKQTESSLGWRRRYFVLTDDALYYFQSSREATSGGKPSASVWNLASCTLSNHRTGLINSTRWHLCVHMHPHHNSKRSLSWVLSSARRDDILNWVSKLREAGAIDEYRAAAVQSVNWASLALGSPSSRPPRDAWGKEPASAPANSLRLDTPRQVSGVPLGGGTLNMTAGGPTTSSGAPALGASFGAGQSGALVNALLRATSERRTSGRSGRSGSRRDNGQGRAWAASGI
jgi:hypothetical protein